MEEQFHLISLDLLPRVFLGDLLSPFSFSFLPLPLGMHEGSQQPSRQRKQEVPACPFAASGSPLGSWLQLCFLVFGDCCGPTVPRLQTSMSWQMEALLGGKNLQRSALFPAPPKAYQITSDLLETSLASLLPKERNNNSAPPPILLLLL